MRLTIFLSAFVVLAALACDQSTATQSATATQAPATNVALGKTYKLKLTGMM